MKTKKVLIADDDEKVRAILRRLLSLHGYETDEARDGGEAIDRLRAGRYDLLLIDSDMPKVSGPQAVAVIRSSPAFKPLKIVMLTGASMTKDVDEAFGLGIDGYLLKPINVARLLTTVAGAVRF